MDVSLQLLNRAATASCSDHRSNHHETARVPSSNSIRKKTDTLPVGDVAQHWSSLQTLTLTVIRESNAISRPNSLHFLVVPTLGREGLWDRIREELELPASLAQCHKYNFVLSDTSANRRFSRSEAVLREALGQIDTLTYIVGGHSAQTQPILDGARRLRQVVVDALSQLLTWKKEIWVSQSTARQTSGSSTFYHSQDAQETVDTTRFVVSKRSQHNHPLVLSSVVHVVLSHLLFGLPHQGCETLLQGFRYQTRLAVQYSRGDLPHLLPEYIPKSLTGAFQHLELNPVLRQYIVCPHCHGLYPAIQPYIMKCTDRPTPNAPVCGTPLLMQRHVNGKTIHVPIKMYLHQEFKQWLARFLSRPEVELFVKSSQSPSGRHDDGTVSDILGSTAIRDFMGPDNLPFLRPVHGQYRLVFALSADGFNPLTNKEAKQIRTSTAIYLICLNLPLAVRQLPHNMYLVGVIPGPSKPKEGELNKYLDLVVDDFLPLWECGVLFNSTSLSQDPILCFAAIIPIICDALGAREVSGFPTITSMQFCIFCSLPLKDIENLDFRVWPKRTCAAHKELAEQWRSADRATRISLLQSSHPARYTSLLRLPYFDPVNFTTIDTMHLLLIGHFQRHCRNVWGMNVKLADGDGSRRGQGVIPSPPSEEDMNIGRLILVSGRADDFVKRGIKKDVLYYLCEENDLRTAGKKRDLLEELKRLVRQRNHVDAEHTPLPRVAAPEVVARKLEPRDIPEITQQAREQFPVTELRLAKNMSMKKCPNDPLRIMCQLRGLEFVNPRPIKSEMIAALLKWRKIQVSQCPLVPCMTMSQLDALAESQKEQRRRDEEAVKRKHDSLARRVTGAHAQGIETTTSTTVSKLDKPSKSQRTQSAVLGPSVLAAYAIDRQNMVLPSWINAPPAKAGHTDRGKMSADQWRVFCTISLPITLIRIWSSRPSEPRWYKMLLNFLDMVIAVEIASLVVTSESLIAQYESLMHRYLETLKSIYKDAPLAPNHHIAMHVGDIMRAFGPTPGYRAFGTERYNYMLQRVNTNRHEFGEMEMTMTRSACRASNLIALLEQPGTVPEPLKETVSRVFQGDKRGTRVNDTAVEHMEDIKTSLQYKNPTLAQSRLDDSMLKALEANLNRGCSKYVLHNLPSKRPDQIYLHPNATFLRLLVVGGVSYRPRERSLGSSQVLVKIDAHHERPAQIEKIFCHTRHCDQGMVEDRFIAVRFLRTLKDHELALDPYRRVNRLYDRCPFKDVFGGLWASELEADIVIVRADQLICHFARTAVEVESISGTCYHVLALSRLKTQFEVDGRLDEEDMSDVEMDSANGQCA